jgi:hypothetical protein
MTIMIINFIITSCKTSLSIILLFYASLEYHFIIEYMSKKLFTKLELTASHSES